MQSQCHVPSSARDSHAVPPLLMASLSVCSVESGIALAVLDSCHSRVLSAQRVVRGRVSDPGNVMNGMVTRSRIRIQDHGKSDGPVLPTAATTTTSATELMALCAAAASSRLALTVRSLARSRTTRSGRGASHRSAAAAGQPTAAAEEVMEASVGRRARKRKATEAEDTEAQGCRGGESMRLRQRRPAPAGHEATERS
jgi:hypothetical protein